jgi:predicted metal-dependent phosphoesterase TrpH
MDPKTILNVAKHVKLDAIAITDHNTIAGAVAARKNCEKGSITVIVGSEISTDFGDVIGIFLNEETKSRSIHEVIEEIKSQDGLVLIPHPFKTKILRINGIIDHLDLLEGCNSRHPITSEQLSALKAMNKPIVAGSDAHFPQEIGLSRTIVHHELNDEEELRKALLEGEIEICGSSSPFYLEPLSQIVKGLKHRDLKLIGWSVLNLIRYRTIKN